MPREKHEAHESAPFLAKSAGYGGPGGCPDLRRFADHSGGTVADSHGLPPFPSLLNVESPSMLRGGQCQHCPSGPTVAFSTNASLHCVFNFGAGDDPPRISSLDSHNALMVPVS